MVEKDSDRVLSDFRREFIELGLKTGSKLVMREQSKVQREQRRREDLERQEEVVKEEMSMKRNPSNMSMASNASSSKKEPVEKYSKGRITRSGQK